MLYTRTQHCDFGESRSSKHLILPNEPLRSILLAIRATTVYRQVRMQTTIVVFGRKSA